MTDLCKLPKTTDKSLVEVFNKEFAKNPYYQVNKRNDVCFTINHYAGKVTYSAENFIEKNRDSLPFRVAELLKNSFNEVISEIFSKSQSELNGTTRATESNNIYLSYNKFYEKPTSKQSVSAQYRVNIIFVEYLYYILIILYNK